MGRKTNKSRRQAQAQSVREKAAAARAIQQRAEQRRRAIVVLVSVVVLALVGGVIAYVAINSNSGGGKATVASQSILSEVTSVPQSVSDKIGAGPAAQREPLTLTNATSMDAHGKPTLLFIGAEFCPYCAAERWAMIEALSRFGTFTGIKQIVSHEDNIDTFTFVNASYKSKYLNFDSKEEEDQNEKPLQSLTSVEQATWAKYPVPGETGEGFPFLYYNGKSVGPIPLIDPTVLIGKSWSQIASSLKDPSSTISQSINGAANVITAGICQMTNNAPASVCTSSITGIGAGFKPYTSS